MKKMNETVNRKGPKTGHIEQKIQLALVEFKRRLDTEYNKPQVATFDPYTLSDTNPSHIASLGFDERLFLVEGNISLVPLVEGHSGAVSDQRRLVWAEDDNSAVAKFVAYFGGMNDHENKYVVNGVSVTEAIR